MYSKLFSIVPNHKSVQVILDHVSVNGFVFCGVFFCTICHFEKKKTKFGFMKNQTWQSLSKENRTRTNAHS